MSKGAYFGFGKAGGGGTLVQTSDSISFSNNLVGFEALNLAGPPIVTNPNVWDPAVVLSIGIDSFTGFYALGGTTLRWYVTSVRSDDFSVPNPGVPDSGTTTILLGLGFAALALFRTRLPL